MEPEDKAGINDVRSGLPEEPDCTAIFRASLSFSKCLLLGRGLSSEDGGRALLRAPLSIAFAPSCADQRLRFTHLVNT